MSCSKIKSRPLTGKLPGRLLSSLAICSISHSMRAILVKDGKGPIESLYIGETATPTLKTCEVLVKARSPLEC